VEQVRAIVLFALCILFLLPLYFLIVGSFTPMVGIMKMPPRFIPAKPTLENYDKFMQYGGLLLRWLANSAIATIISIGLNIIIMGAAAYALALYRLKPLKYIYFAFAATMMVSRYSTIIPLFVLARIYQLRGLVAVIATSIFIPGSFFLMHDFMKKIPRDFVDSARIDGAGEVRILLRIMLPLCKPVVGVVVAIFAGAIYSDFMWQRLLLQGEEQMTFVVGIMTRLYILSTQGGYIHNYGVEMASGVLILLPMVAIFLWSNRYFIGGLTLGGIKE